MRRLLTIFILVILVGCATPAIKESEGLREYGLKPSQVLKIDNVTQVLELDKDGVLQIVSLTDEQVARLVRVLKAIDPFGIKITQDMGMFNIEILVEKETTEGSHTQTATTKTDASGELGITP